MKQRTFRPNDTPDTPAPAPASKKARVIAPGMPLPAFERGTDSSPSGQPNSGATASAPPVPDRQLVQIPVELIDPNPLAPREVYTPQMIRDRAEALRDQGQHDPIHVIPNPDFPGRFIICDGWTRVQACVDHKVLPSLLAQVHPELSLEDAAWFGYQQNEEREQHCDLDRAMFYAKLINAGVAQSVVAKKANKSKTLMSFYMAMASLPEDILDIFRERTDKFGSLVGHHVARVLKAKGHAKAVSLALRYKDEDQPVRWLINQAEAILGKEQGKARTSVSKFSKTFSNGYFKQRGDKFEVQIQVAPEQRETFFRAMEELLSTVAIEPQPEGNDND